MAFLRTLFKIFSFVLLISLLGLAVIYRNQLIPIAESSYAYCQGEYALRQRHVSEAKAYFKDALKGFPDRSMVYLKLADIAASQHQDDAAIEYYQRVLDQKPHHMEALVHIARYEWEAGRHRVALNMFRDVLAAHPENKRLKREVGDLFVNFARETKEPADYENASQLLKGFLTQNKEDDNSRFKLGEVLFALGEYEEALPHYCILSQKYPESAETAYSMSISFLKNEAPRQAYLFMKKASELAELEDPVRGQSWANVALKYRQMPEHSRRQPTKAAQQCVADWKAYEKEHAKDDDA